MIADGRVYLDTNIFIYGLEGGNDASDRIAELLIRGASARKRFFTSAFVAAELFVIPYREGNLDIIAQYEHVLSGNGIEVLPLSPLAYRYAAALRAGKPSLKLPDALHLAMAILGEASHFLTADSGITAPLDLAGPAALVSPPSDLAILRPDLATLNALLKSLDP